MKKILSSALITPLLLTTTLQAASEYHAPHTSQPVHFEMSVIDDHASGAYGLIGHDISLNGYTDLVSFAYTGTTAGLPEGEIYWYEFQPGKNDKAHQWKKHLITKKKHVVHGAFMDVDHDGFDDLVFMSDFEVPIKDKNKEGDLWWAKRPKDLNVHEWQTFWIGRTAAAHRIVAADIDGTGQKRIIVVPLFGEGEKPVYGAAPITLYTPNTDPHLPWKKVTFEHAQFHAMHDAVTIAKKDGTKGEDILIAAKEGLIKLSFSKDGDTWQLSTNVLHPTPKDTNNDKQARDKGIIPHGLTANSNWKLSGITSLSSYNASEGTIAAIDYTDSSSYLSDEPWHGDTVSLYIAKDKSHLTHTSFERRVLERRSPGGHAVKMADLRGNGCLDIVAGFRAYPTAFVVYLCEKLQTQTGNIETVYKKQIISERSANAIVIGNWNKNGLPDIATAGYGNEGDPYILMWSNKNG